jgi:adenine phosphoribosyltransferase
MRFGLFYEIKIAGLTRALPVCRVNETLSIAAFIMFGDTELTIAAAKELLKKCGGFDYILTAEAKGIPLAYEMSRQSGKKYFVARKLPKLYMTGLFEVSVKSITTVAEQKLFLDTAEAEQLRGKRVLLCDDVISTGASLAALETLAQKAGAVVACKVAVLAEGDAANREDIAFLQELPLFFNS